MSRNRMKNSQSLHWMGVVKWVMIAGLLSGLGLFYMFSINYNMKLAQDTFKLQKQLEIVSARNAQLSTDLKSMKTPKLVQARLTQMHSSLVSWGDTRADWVRLDQNTRARLAPVGTTPRSPLGLNSSNASKVASSSVP